MIGPRYCSMKSRNIFSALKNIAGKMVLNRESKLNSAVEQDISKRD